MKIEIELDVLSSEQLRNIKTILHDTNGTWELYKKKKEIEQEMWHGQATKAEYLKALEECKNRAFKYTTNAYACDLINDEINARKEIEFVEACFSEPNKKA